MNIEDMNGARALVIHSKWGLVMFETEEPDEVSAAMDAVAQIRAEKANRADSRPRPEEAGEAA